MSNGDLNTEIAISANSSPEARGMRLKSLRLMAGLSRQTIEEKYDISAATLRSWEDGKHTGLTEQGAKRILVMLKNEGIQCSVGWLLHGMGSAPKLPHRLSADTMTVESEKELVSESSEAHRILEEIKLFHKLHPEGIVFTVSDDGMEPFF